MQNPLPHGPLATVPGANRLCKTQKIIWDLKKKVSIGSKIWKEIIYGNKCLIAQKIEYYVNFING